MKKNVHRESEKQILERVASDLETGSPILLEWTSYYTSCMGKEDYALGKLYMYASPKEKRQVEENLASAGYAADSTPISAIVILRKLLDGTAGIELEEDAYRNKWFQTEDGKKFESLTELVDFILENY